MPLSTPRQTSCAYHLLAQWTVYHHVPCFMNLWSAATTIMIRSGQIIIEFKTEITENLGYIFFKMMKLMGLQINIHLTDLNIDTQFSTHIFLPELLLL